MSRNIEKDKIELISHNVHLVKFHTEQGTEKIVNIQPRLLLTNYEKRLMFEYIEIKASVYQKASAAKCQMTK